MKWSRRPPSERGKYYSAVRHPKDREYMVKIVDVFGPLNEEEGFLVSGIWAMAMPVSTFEGYDVWWGSEVKEPDPPVYKKNKKKPI